MIPAPGVVYARRYVYLNESRLTKSRSGWRMNVTIVMRVSTSVRNRRSMWSIMQRKKDDTIIRLLQQDRLQARNSFCLNRFADVIRQGSNRKFRYAYGIVRELWASAVSGIRMREYMHWDWYFKISRIVNKGCSWTIRQNKSGYADHISWFYLYGLIDNLAITKENPAP